MRFGASNRPYGARLGGPTNVKVKGVMQVHKNSDSSATPKYWSSMWGAGFDWVGWLKKGIDQTKALGANTIKILGPDYLATVSGALPNTVLDRIRQYLDYTASVGLYVYWGCQSDRYYLGGASTTTQAQDVALVQAQARIVNDYPHVIGLDMENEYNFPFADATFAAAVFPAVKAVAPLLPVTISLTDNYIRNPNDSLVTALKPYVDYWDFHWYETTDGGGARVPGPTSSHVAAFRASSNYKPFIFGESGTPEFPGAGVAGGSANITAHWQLLGDTAAAAPDCYGAVGFSLTDFDAANFGVFAEALTTPKSQSATPFATWRGVK